MTTIDIFEKKLYTYTIENEKITAVIEYNVTLEGDLVISKTLVGTMYYDLDANGKQVRKKYASADGNEQKYIYEFKDEQNIAAQLPSGTVTHSKFDHLGRKVFDEIQLGKGLSYRKFSYYKGEVTETHEAGDKKVSAPETTLVSLIEFANGRTIAYEYDKEARITKVIDSEDGKTVYEYDARGQLTKEVQNAVFNVDSEVIGGDISVFEYDNYGNIKTKDGKLYAYDNGNWKDLLTAYNGQSISYDANGNPINYLGTSCEWEKGRQLRKFGDNYYTYNKDGIRISKTTDNCAEHKYILDGTNIIKETVNNPCTCFNYTNEYLYDLDGTPCGLKHNGTVYYFYKNLQGDIVEITDETGATLAQYSYDAWGKCDITSDTSGVGIAAINPFRYRGYYFDTDTNLYYLQSRYYDPETGRFVNADDVNAIISSDLTSLKFNLFAYCDNNPVNNTDASGNLVAQTIARVILGMMLGFFIQMFTDLISEWYDKTFGAGTFKYSPGDYLASVLTWSTAFLSFNKKSVEIVVIVLPFILKQVGRIINKNFNFGTFLIDCISLFVTIVISLYLTKSAKNKVKKLFDKNANKIKVGAKDSFLARLRLEEKTIKLAASKLGFKLSLSITISNTVIQFIYDLMLSYFSGKKETA